MPKLSVKDLQTLRENLQAERMAREGKTRAQINVHMGTCGIASGARQVMAALLDEIEKRNIHDVQVITSGCAGLCSHEPMATVQRAEEPPVKYVHLDEEKIVRILREHALEGHVVQEYVLATGSETVG